MQSFLTTPPSAKAKIPALYDQENTSIYACAVDLPWVGSVDNVDTQTVQHRKEGSKMNHELEKDPEGSGNGVLEGTILALTTWPLGKSCGSYELMRCFLRVASNE